MTTQATAIRDAIYDRLAALPAYKTVRKTQVPQEQPDNLPSVSIFITDERGVPDGDPEVGDIRFESEVTIAISVVRGFDDNRVLEGYIDQDVDEIEAMLLADGSFTRLGDGGLFDAVTALQRRRLYPQGGEAYFAELRLELTFKFNVNFEPGSVPLSSVHETVRPINHPNSPVIEREWTLPTE